MTELFIARHGQNEDNLNGTLNGHRDLSLTELGRQQAQTLAQGIDDLSLSFDTIYSSPLSRAYETAQIVANHLKMNQDPVVMDELIERDFGIMTGRPQTEIEEICGQDVIKTDTITYFLNPEGAETFPELVERGHMVIKKVRGIETGTRALLVCHGDIGKMIYAAATGKDWREILVGFHFGNGDLIEIDNQDEAHKIKIPQHNL